MNRNSKPNAVQEASQGDSARRLIKSCQVESKFFLNDFLPPPESPCSSGLWRNNDFPAESDGTRDSFMLKYNI